MPWENLEQELAEEFTQESAWQPRQRRDKSRIRKPRTAEQLAQNNVKCRARYRARAALYYQLGLNWKGQPKTRKGQGGNQTKRAKQAVDRVHRAWHQAIARALLNTSLG